VKGPGLGVRGRGGTRGGDKIPLEREWGLKLKKDLWSSTQGAPCGKDQSSEKCERGTEKQRKKKKKKARH